jgi:truncated hemoglobin YjbI
MAKQSSSPARRRKALAGREGSSLYERIGAEKVERLIAEFYARVDNDPVIRPLYGKTLTCAIHGLTHFMIRWLGGPPVYDLDRTWLRRRHAPFAIDARARDAWLANMKAAVREARIPEPEASVLLAHLEFGARLLVNTGNVPRWTPGPAADGRFDRGLAERWNRMAEIEELFDAIARGDLAALESLLPKRLVPHVELMCHVLVKTLDPLGRKGRRFGRSTKRGNPLEVVELLLARRDLDVEPAAGDHLARFRYLQATMQAYAHVSAIVDASPPLQAALREVTRDRFLTEVERDPSAALLVGLRGQTLLHEAAMAGDAELAAALIRAGADPDAKEPEGHTPLYRASTGEVARVLLAAGASADVTSGPTRGTPLHQAARRGSRAVAAALLDHGANIEARDAKGETPLRRAVNCRQAAVVRELVRRGADAHAADKRGVTPAAAARSADMQRALAAG